MSGAMFTKAAAAIERRPALLVFLALALVGLAFGLDLPWTDDARFYVAAAEAYGRFFADALGGVLRLDFTAFSRQALDRAFAVNHEHPPVAKYLMASGWLVLHASSGLLDPIAACRVPVVLLWAWTGALVYRLLAPRTSTTAALFGVLAFALLPRVYFDGHAETLDAPVMAFITATVERYLRYLEAPSARRAIAAVAFFALALGSKLNAPFALIALVALTLLFSPPRREGTALRLAPIPWPLVGMVSVAPLVVFATWPWLWFDTGARLAAYLRFHAQHYGILFYYGGVVHADDVAPWTAPWRMAAMTLPLPVLLLALAGAAPPLGRLLAAAPSPLRRLLTPTPLASARRLGLGVAAMLVAATQLGALSLPGVPVYGGVKLFLAAFPFIAVLAALGFDAVARELAARTPRRAAELALGALLLTPGLVGLVAYRRAPLSYYAEWTGGLRGAVSRGFERQYYDLAYPELAAALHAALPNGGAFAVLPNPKEYAPYLRRWQDAGELPRTLRLASAESAAVLVLTHERRWPEYAELAARYRTRRVLARFEVAGVPLFTLYDLRR